MISSKKPMLRRTAFLLFPLSSLIAFSPSQAQESEAEVEPETRTCISTRSIRRTRIIDDRNVLIYLSSRRIYHNVLRNNCRGLKRLGTFSYNSSDGQMCEGDGIASIQGAWDDVRPIPQCWLGVHRRITREEANDLRDASKRRPKIAPKPIPLPEPEEVGAEPEDPES